VRSAGEAAPVHSKRERTAFRADFVEDAVVYRAVYLAMSASKCSTGKGITRAPLLGVIA